MLIMSVIYLLSITSIYKPWLNKSLNEFRNSWNSHPVRTEHNQSPSQLFTAGALSLRRSGRAALDFFDRIDNTYGVDEQGFYSSEGEEGVTIPETAIDSNRWRADPIASFYRPTTP